MALSVCAAAMRGAWAMDARSFESALHEGQVTAVERALELLPLTMRSRFVLMFDSRSLQQASFADPRVILFTSDAKFIVSFNGHPGQRGYHALEVMQFDDERKTFTLLEFAFPPAQSPQAAVVVSEPNPEKCLTCHGHPARPVWDTPPSWPGAYGERYRMALSPQERDGLRAFVDAQPSHPRYRALRNLGVFGDAGTFYPNASQRYNGQEVEPPNAVLSKLLSELNAQAIAATLARAPQFQTYRYTLLATLTRDCGTVREVLPDLPGAFAGEQFDAFREATHRGVQLQAAAKQARLLRASDGPSARAAVDNESLTRLRYVAESRLGVSSAEWTLALEKGTHDYSAPDDLGARLDALLRLAVAQDDPSIQDLASLREVGQTQKYCGYLRRRGAQFIQAARVPTPPATEAVATREVATASRTPARGPARLDGCIDCHRGGIGPELPFDDPRALSPLLPAGSYPHGSLLGEILFRLSASAGNQRMPAGRLLGESERAELSRYFSDLAAAASR